jgi:hypothetical protein
MKATIRRSLPVLLLLVPAVFAGCGQDTLLGPNAGIGSDNAVLGTTVSSKTLTPEDGWYPVGSGRVQPGQEVNVVQGSRYTVTFSKGAVHNTMTITIMEHNPDVVDVQLYPDGSKFDAPVTLAVDYSGTSNDPSSSTYHGRKLHMMRYNNQMGKWENLAGHDDPATRTYTVTLTGFSRYAMGDMTGGGPTDGTRISHKLPVAETEGQN